MTHKNLELKIYVAATLLLDLLDETEEDTRFKNKLRFNINRTITELEKITDAPLDGDVTSLFITDAWTALETSIDNRLKIVNGK